MTNLMKWFSANYILPQIEKQPMDFEDQVRIDSLKNQLPMDMHASLSAVNNFYAVQGFRMGLKLGAALGEELGARA